MTQSFFIDRASDSGLLDDWTVKAVGVVTYRGTATVRNGRCRTSGNVENAPREVTRFEVAVRRNRRVRRFDCLLDAPVPDFLVVGRRVVATLRKNSGQTEFEGVKSTVWYDAYVVLSLAEVPR